MWTLFEKSFLPDLSAVTQPMETRDTVLDTYVTNSVMTIINTFFNSPFSDQSTTVQVIFSCMTVYRKLRTSTPKNSV